MGGFFKGFNMSILFIIILQIPILNIIIHILEKNMTSRIESIKDGYKITPVEIISFICLLPFIIAIKIAFMCIYNIWIEFVVMLCFITIYAIYLNGMLMIKIEEIKKEKEKG